MAGVNKCIFVGNITRDPDIKHLSDVKVANFTIAVNKSWKDRQTDEWKEKVEFVRIVAWRYLAEKAERSLTKGKQCFVEGELETRKWTDKEGNDKYTTEIIARDIQLMGRKDDDEQAPAPKLKGDTYGDDDTEDLPF